MKQNQTPGASKLAAICRINYFQNMSAKDIADAVMELPEQERLDLARRIDRKSTRLNSSHLGISYAVFCLKKCNNNSTTSLSSIVSLGMPPYLCRARC